MTEGAQLLIVDDDERICRLLRRYLESEGYHVDAVTNGNDMWQQVKHKRPDLIVLDVMLPDVDGVTLARELRSRTDIGIIMLTGKNDLVDTIVGLEVGADDYITKPFENRELLARIRSVLRRLSVTTPEDKTGASGSDNRVVRFNDWKMDLDSYELISPAGSSKHLSTYEFRLLSMFVRKAGHVLSRAQILQELSSREWSPDDRSVDVLIGKLRKEIEENPAQPKLIRTVRNAGYQFTAKVHKEQA